MNDVVTEAGTVGSYVLLRLDGELDLSNASDVQEELFDALPPTVPGAILDLATLQYVDSAGIRVLFDLVRRLEVRRQTCALSLPAGARVRRLLEITGLDQVLPVRETPEACARALRDADNTSRSRARRPTE